jgi:hypothetical protein
MELISDNYDGANGDEVAVVVSSSSGGSNRSTPQRRHRHAVQRCCVCLDTIGMHSSPSSSSSGSSSALSVLGCNSDSSEDGHVLCGECVCGYVDSLCGDFGKLQAHKFEVVCPVPQCAATHFTFAQLRPFLSPRVLDKYVSTLVRICNMRQQAESSARTHSRHHHQNHVSPESSPALINTSKSTSSPGSSSSGAGGDQHAHEQTHMEHTRKLILDCLCLKCPNTSCRSVLDPTPDGCCAMKCLHCGTFFCWLCFSVHKTSPACHEHVRNDCVHNAGPSAGSVFVNNVCVRTAHKRLRIATIHSLLVKYYMISTCSHTLTSIEDVDYSAHTLRAHSGVMSVLESVRADLADMDITADDVLTEPHQHRVFVNNNNNNNNNNGGGFLMWPFNYLGNTVLQVLFTVVVAAFVISALTHTLQALGNGLFNLVFVQNKADTHVSYVGLLMLSVCAHVGYACLLCVYWSVCMAVSAVVYCSNVITLIVCWTAYHGFIFMARALLTTAQISCLVVDHLFTLASFAFSVCWIVGGTIIKFSAPTVMAVSAYTFTHVLTAVNVLLPMLVKGFLFVGDKVVCSVLPLIVCLLGKMLYYMCSLTGHAMTAVLRTGQLLYIGA